LANNNYLICIVRPPGYLHSGAFLEIAETLSFALQALGCTTAIQENRFAADACNIVLGANLIGENQMAMIPPGTILYNLEQIDPASKWLRPAFLELMRKFTVWDYSLRNIERLRQAGPGPGLRHVPLGYMPQMSRIAAVDKPDIDVLFYGSLNPRRSAILDALRAADLRVHAPFGIYGAQRDALIARSRVVLNMHYYESSIFEIVRVSYLLANRKAVVTECHSGTEIDADMHDAVAPASYDRLVDTCMALVRDTARRQELEQRGFARMAARDEVAIVRAALMPA
jgi:hypothetical protein